MGLRMRQGPMEHTNKVSPFEEIPSETKTVDAQKIILQVRRKATSKLLEHTKEIVLKNPIERLPLFNEELEKLIDAFAEYGIDPSPLKLKIKTLMTDVARYNAMQSACSEKMAPEVQTQRLADNKSRLDRAFTLQIAEKCHYESLLDSLASLEKRREKLKREQEKLEERIEKLHCSISRRGEEKDKLTSVVDRLLEQKVEIAKSPVLTAKDAKNLKKLKDSIQTQCNGFKDFTFG